MAKLKTRDIPFTVHSFALFLSKVVRPAMDGLKKESVRIRKAMEDIHSLCTNLSKKMNVLNREYQALTDQTRRIELRLHGANQQAILVLRDQIVSLRKKIEDLEKAR